MRMNQTDSYKLTDLDYLIGDHRLQMLKVALPFLSIPQQRALSLAVKFQELRRTYRLFSDEETASLGVCSLDAPPKNGSPKEMLKAIRPYGNPREREVIDMAQNLMDGQTPMEQLMRLLSPEQQSRLETIQLLMQTLQTMGSS